MGFVMLSFDLYIPFGRIKVIPLFLVSNLTAYMSLPLRFLNGYFIQSGPGSSVGISTGYGLDGTGIESRLGARFSAPVQTGPGVHPDSCTMGT